MGPVLGRITGWLGWRYLVLHRVFEQTGQFNPAMPPDETAAAGTAAPPCDAAAPPPVGVGAPA